MEGELSHCRRWESAECQPHGGGNLELWNYVQFRSAKPALCLSSPEVHLALAAFLVRKITWQTISPAARLREMSIWKDLGDNVRDFMLWVINRGETGLGETLPFL